MKLLLNIILEWICKEKLINTKLRESTLKKLKKDCCIKTAFSFDGIILKQEDGVSIDSSFGPLVANMIMTESELERVIDEPMITSGKIKFYKRYVDDTLLLVKEEDIIFVFDNNVVIRNGKIVWKVVWIEHYLWLNLSSRRY